MLNERAISSVKNGEASGFQTGLHLITGSRAEGFAMEPGWGHEEPDKDVMIIYGGSHTVATKPVCPNEKHLYLSISTDACYPAYCRIKATESLQNIPSLTVTYIQKIRMCVVNFLLGISVLDIGVWLVFFLLGGTHAEIWKLTCVPYMYSLVHRVPRLPRFIRQNLGAIQIALLCEVYGNTKGMFLFLLTVVYLLKPRLIFSLLVTNVVSSSIIGIFPGYAISLVVVFEKLGNVACRMMAKEIYIYWLGYIFFYLDLERIGGAFLYELLHVLLEDETHHALSFQLYNMMTSSSTWSSGVLNMWLVFVTSGDTRWLSSVKSMQKRCQVDLSKAPVSGPSQAYRAYDLVPALLCAAPFPGSVATSDKWYKVAWPSNELCDAIANIPGVLVAVGHSLSANTDIEWRTSWSIPELLLAETIPAWAKQGYRAFKYTVNTTLKRERMAKGNTRGRGKVGSYHMKTVLYISLQNPKPWNYKCPYELFIFLLRKLKHHLRTGKLPHFFIPECNLFQTTPQAELDLAIQCVKQIISDPVIALLKSPLVNHEVYGKWPWVFGERSRRVILIELFSSIRIKQLSEEGTHLLRQTVQQVDLCRRQKYLKQRKFDIERGISTRNKIISLEKMLFI